MRVASLPRSCISLNDVPHRSSVSQDFDANKDDEDDEDFINDLIKLYALVPLRPACRHEANDVVVGDGSPEAGTLQPAL